MKSQRGWTLIELVAVLLILGVVCGFAASAVGGTIEASRSAAARSALLESLRSASSRAAIVGMHGVLCPSVDGLHCRNEPDWSDGWLVFLDANGSREFEGG